MLGATGPAQESPAGGGLAQPRERSPSWPTWAAPGWLALAGVVCYANSARGPFLFDDAAFAFESGEDVDAAPNENPSDHDRRTPGWAAWWNTVSTPSSSPACAASRRSVGMSAPVGSAARTRVWISAKSRNRGD